MYYLVINLVFILSVGLSGCAVERIGMGILPDGTPVYLHASPPSLEDVKAFRKTHFLEAGNEQSKIEFLLKRVRTSPYTFLRNGESGDGEKTVEFIRWKITRPRWRGKVKTVQDFVNVIMNGSVMSGECYVAVLPGEGQHNLQSLLKNELNALESLLKS